MVGGRRERLEQLVVAGRYLPRLLPVVEQTVGPVLGHAAVLVLVLRFKSGWSGTTLGQKAFWVLLVVIVLAHIVVGIDAQYGGKNYDGLEEMLYTYTIVPLLVIVAISFASYSPKASFSRWFHGVLY